MSKRWVSGIKIKVLMLGILPVAITVLILGTYILNTQLENLRSEQTLIIRNSLYMLIGGLIIAGVSALLLSRRVTKPLSRLTSAVARMRQGDLTATVPEDSMGELRTLEEGFNAMALALKNSRENMQLQIDKATTELKQTMAALETQNVELDLARKRALKASKAKTEFLASMSHEIRTPMSGVLGFARLLLKTNLEHEQRELAKILEKSASGLLHIVNDILNYSQLDYGSIEPEHIPFDIVDCFEDSAVLMGPTAHEKHLELALLIYGDVPEVLIGDETRVRQILLNLVGNAIKYTHKGEIVIRVMLEAETETSCTLQFSVADTGIGIARQAQENLFNSFQQGSYQVNSVHEGAGLGLSISRKLAESMKGQISLDSEEGKGSCFRVTLNLEKTPNESADIISKPFLGKRALLLDNHEISRISIRYRLEALGMDVSEGMTSALPVSRSEVYDLVVMGFTADEIYLNTPIAEIIRRISALTTGARLALLSTSDRSILMQIQQSTNVNCFSKPLTRNALRRILKDILSESGQDDQQLPETVSPSYPSRSFLVADDDDINLKLISTILKASGATITEVKNGLEALNFTFKERFDLIFLDLHMPVMSGVQVTREIRAMEAPNRHIPIIALTADAVTKNKRDALTAGIDAYLIKPVDERILWQVIDSFLGDNGNSSANTKSENKHPAQVDYAKKIETKPKIVGVREALDDDLYEQFLNELPNEIRKIKKAYRKLHWHDLSEHAHRLHGSTAVCGVSGLKKLTAALELASNHRNQNEAKKLLRKIESESRRLCSG